MLSYGSAPCPPPPPLFRHRSSFLTGRVGGGWAWSRIIQPQDSIAFYASLHHSISVNSSWAAITEEFIWFGLDFSQRSIFDRRNPYRRPSALGVPSRHLSDFENTEYSQQVITLVYFKGTIAWDGFFGSFDPIYREPLKNRRNLRVRLKVQKNEKFFDSDLEFFTFSLLGMLKY